ISIMEDRFGHRISYLRVSITDRCNERCQYCMPDEMQEWLPRGGILSYEEIERVVRVGVGLGIRKLRVTGGEPLTRRDVLGFMRRLCGIDGVDDVGISTNGTLLARSASDHGAETVAHHLVDSGVRSANISLDTLDRAAYRETTGRDYLPRVIEGIDAALAAGMPSVKINSVLMNGRNDSGLLDMVEFARTRGLLLRFIELMPVSRTDVITEENFLSAGRARKMIEAELGELKPRPDFKTNGPSSYFEVPGSGQLIGFIGAMTNFHFCESCNKLRLTCDGKLRPCLGSHLEFDMLEQLRGGASDADLERFFKDVVERKPEAHDFRDNYQPKRRMIAIGG
ncbi:MAG: GTP 3',8-cyclase MoaA, partial [Verrucomicrobiales bacterium]